MDISDLQHDCGLQKEIGYLKEQIESERSIHAITENKLDVYLRLCDELTLKIKRLQHEIQVLTKSPELINLKETANILKFHPRSVFYLAKNGKLPAGKIGNNWRVNKTELLEWIEHKNMEGNTDAD